MSDNSCDLDELDPTWVVNDGSFEKMGALTNENASRLLGFYDELSAFLSQINLYRGQGLSDSHQLALFSSFQLSSASCTT